jgi:small subunit ribosomal protein S16
MAVRIRLRRTGKRNAPAHRIVVADQRSPRDGRFIEVVGHYDPRNRTESVRLDRVDYWLSQGAQPSDTVDAIVKRARAGVSLPPKEKPAQEPPKPKKQPELEPETEAEETAEAAESTDVAEDEAAEKNE